RRAPARRPGPRTPALPEVPQARRQERGPQPPGPAPPEVPEPRSPPSRGSAAGRRAEGTRWAMAAPRPPRAAAPPSAREAADRPALAPRVPSGAAPVEGDRRSHRRWGWPRRTPGASRSYGGALRREPRAPLPGSSGVLESGMRRAEPSVRLLQLPVDDGGDPHAVANAEGDRTVTKVSAVHVLQARGGQPRSHRSPRLPRSDCASVNGDPVHIDPERAGDDHGDRGEGLVDLPEVDVRDLEAGTSERLPRRGDGTGEHQHRIGARDGRGDDLRARLASQCV